MFKNKDSGLAINEKIIKIQKLKAKRQQLSQLRAKKEELAFQCKRDMDNLKDLIARNKRHPSHPLVSFPFVFVQNIGPATKFEVEKERRKILISSREELLLKGDFQFLADFKETAH